MTTPSIRPATDDEKPALARRICAIDPWLRLGSTPDAMLASWNAEPQWKHLVATDDTGILGAVIFCLHCGPDRVRALGVGHFLDLFYPASAADTARAGYIRILAVFPGAQARGTGQALLAAAEFQVAGSTDRIFLCVSDVNTGARRLYERLGYAFVGAIHDCIIPGNTENLMTKPLTPTAE